MRDMSQRLLTSEGRSIDLYLAGPMDGTPLIFHCGTPGSGLPYPPFVDALASRGLRYVRWNRPGYGSSTRRPGRSVVDVVVDTTTVLDHLRADDAYVLGWSGGGPHAIACAALLPERVIGAATIGGVAPLIAVPVHIWQGAHDRMVPFAHGKWLAAHCGGACPHLFAEHGHLTLAVDSLHQILDELTARTT